MLRSFMQTRWKQVALGAGLLFAVVNWDSILMLVCMGYWPQSHIEHLQNPVAVTSWGSEGLHLADGHTAQLPGFTKLPIHSEALTRIAEKGVELSPDGRVTGLLRIWHWCGNDSMRNEVVRVDVAHVLEFLREGEFSRPIHKYDFAPLEPGGGFGSYGWSVSDYGHYQRFLKGKQSELLKVLDEEAKKKKR